MLAVPPQDGAQPCQQHFRRGGLPPASQEEIVQPACRRLGWRTVAAKVFQGQRPVEPRHPGPATLKLPPRPWATVLHGHARQGALVIDRPSSAGTSGSSRQRVIAFRETALQRHVPQRQRCPGGSHVEQTGSAGLFPRRVWRSMVSPLPRMVRSSLAAMTGSPCCAVRGVVRRRQDVGRGCRGRQGDGVWTPPAALDALMSATRAVTLAAA